MNLKRVLALLLAVALVFVCSGCDLDNLLTGGAKEKLVGNWSTDVTVEEELVREILSEVDFYDQEVALFDLTGMKCRKLVSFTSDGNYVYSYDVAESKAMVRAYFSDCIDILYDNRQDLVTLYDSSIVDMSREEFREAYAGMFELDSFEALLDLYVECSLDFESMAEPLEKGTYTVGTGYIMCKIEGEAEAEGMEYELTDDTLKLIYTNATEDYTRIP